MSGNQYKKQILSCLSFLHGFILASCTNPIISMKCQEIRMRMENAETADQKRFAAAELEDCEKNRNEVKSRDSTLFEGIQNRDYPLVQGIIVYMSLVYLGVYFLVDFINEKIDPRIVG